MWGRAGGRLCRRPGPEQGLGQREREKTTTATNDGADDGHGDEETRNQQLVSALQLLIQLLVPTISG